MADKKADLAGPGIGNYDDLKHELPDDYEPLLSPKETMQAVFAIKNYIEENLCKELNLQMVQVPLIVDKDSGVNDTLDRDGSRTPVEFDCGLGLERRSGERREGGGPDCARGAGPGLAGEALLQPAA